MKYLIILLTACAICMGCKKNRTVIAKGKVINPVTGEGQEGFEVRILKNTTGSLGTTGGVEEVVETFTDANGNFEIQHTGSGTYQLSCNLPVDNYPIGWYQNGEKVNSSTVRMSVPKGEETYAEYHSVPNCDYNLQINNVNCFDANDEIKLKAQTEVNSVSPNAPFLIQNGCESINYGLSEYPMGKVYYYYEVTKNGSTTIHYDTLEVSCNGVSTHVIEY